MSRDDQARLTEALKVLCDISRDALRSHRAEVLMIFQKLEAVVRDPLLSQVTYESTPSAMPNTIDTPPSFSAQASINGASTPVPISPRPTDDNQTTSSPTIARLVQALDDNSSQIQDFLRKPEFEATIDELERVNEDPRIVDLQLHKCRSSLKVRFRKGLSQRSLAIEFSQWECCTYGWSRVNMLTRHLSFSRREGHIAEYLKRNTHRFKNQKVTRDGIQHGVKMLACEKLLGEKAISAILCFKYRLFRAVKLEELDSLVKAVHQKAWIVELISQKTDWLDDCQEKYNAWCDEMLQKLNPRGPLLESDRCRRLDGSATNIRSAATLEATTSPSYVQEKGLESSMQADVSGSDGTIPMQWVASDESPPLSRESSISLYDFATLTPAYPLPVPQQNSTYEYDFSTLTPAYPLSVPQQNSIYQYPFARLPQVNSSLSPDTMQFGFATGPCDPCTLLPQPLPTSGPQQ